MKTRSPLLARARSRRPAVAAAWLGSVALVIGGSTAAVAGIPPTSAEGSAAANSTAGGSSSAGSTDYALAAAPAVVHPAAATVPGEYVVVLKSASGLRAAGVTGTSAPAVVKAAAQRGRALGAQVKREFSNAIQGYSATLSPSELAAVKADPAVAYVEPNRTYQVSGATQTNPTWGLDRVDERTLPLDKKYYYTATGAGVMAYIIDTGIAKGHPDFGTIDAGPNILNDEYGDEDCNGHGTHVAGTIGGDRYGIAKSVRMTPVRVLDCDGSGYTDDVVAGIDWVLAQGFNGPRLANLSLGSEGIDPVVDAAVQKMIDAGITVVLAAGNGTKASDYAGVSACSVSPAHLKAAIVVGATTKTDKRTSFSNYGSCVDLYAPGTDITSDWPKSASGTWQINTISGTSMAAPHVAGTVAMYLQRHPKSTPAQVQAALLKTATPNKVTNVSSKWPRLLLLALQPAVKPTSVTSGNKLKYNQSLVRGNKLCSKNKAYCLSPEASGKLVLRKVTGTKKVVWTSGKSVYWTRMTSTGALSSYDTYGRRVWTSKKTGGKATLYVVSSGYLAILRNSDDKVLWTSK